MRYVADVFAGCNSPTGTIIMKEPQPEVEAVVA